MEDSKLIVEIKNGKIHLFDELIKRYYGKVYYYCYRHLNNKEAAQDLTQEVFMKVIKTIGGYKHYGKFENYLYVVAGNACKDFYKKESKYILKEVEDGSSEEEISKLENKVIIEEALNKLSDNQREIIILRFYQDLKIKDIAKIMNSGISITKYRLKKAIKLISESMKGGQA
ncbi:RNA polymerase subunit sigma [Clostridium botulinum A2B3 87]|uniref:RNA polymerase sigma factor n=1 Tax=Clostridium botulinum TaxID=1491 RepID=UPI0001F84F49|nr:sigma-70 family RNA polymerase sigma factor [Clostridium botulinum]KEI98598.1 RNA polymerase subunit sigma [Clostridium botulinum A2B3 87]NFB15784.1 sigma-70 family RNA polymerase sigma factor [Clostridium botulinum]NFB66208.1 sigma-70 family RNA polymerase sigma factor [Clostridium botulinum]NFB97006.1 sigma-70 family RNA polymerase sigma factor [Clostridium botulinum]NFC45829.1 sigma-70 family RNA polymerase sigma factor [Clostridium botulinum]